MLDSRIARLAETLSDAAARLNRLVKQSESGAGSDHSRGSGDADVVHALEPIADDVLDAASELHDLLLDPSDLLRTYATHAHLISFHFIHRFQIAGLVPQEGTISYGDLAEQCGQPEADVRRLLRHAMTIKIFDEPAEGFVCHTRASLLLCEESFHNWMGATCEESWPAATRTVEAMLQYPGSEEPNQSGFALANGNLSLYNLIGTSPDRAARFAKGMRAYSSGPAFSANHLISTCHTLFASLPTDAIFVDVGGGSGHISQALAQAFPQLWFIVQDLPATIATSLRSVQPNSNTGPLEVGLAAPRSGPKIVFASHDFFTPQPVSGAAVYYLRWILHNWGHDHSVAILRNLIPALVPGSRILINDYVLDGWVSPAAVGTMPMSKRRLASAMDIGMQQLLNARERTESDWATLLQDADESFKWQSVKRPEGSALAIIEILWQPDEVHA